MKVQRAREIRAGLEAWRRTNACYGTWKYFPTYQAEYTRLTELGQAAFKRAHARALAARDRAKFDAIIKASYGDRGPAWAAPAGS